MPCAADEANQLSCAYIYATSVSEKFADLLAVTSRTIQRRTADQTIEGWPPAIRIAKSNDLANVVSFGVLSVHLDPVFFGSTSHRKQTQMGISSGGPDEIPSLVDAL
jgi:hypothetical protein